MAKVTYYENFVDVYGKGWLRDVPINTRYTIKPSEVDTVLQAIIQGTVAEWVKRRAGDFSRVTGFHLEVLDHVVRMTDTDTKQSDDFKEIKGAFMKAAYKKIKESFMEAVKDAGGDADRIWKNLDSMTARELILHLAPNNVLFYYKKPEDVNDS